MARRMEGEDAERLARRLAALRNAHAHPVRLRDELVAIGRHCAELPELDPRSAEEISGYDEHGIPC